MLPSNVEDDPKFRERVGVFKDRTNAGKLLADKLSAYTGRSESAIVVAIPSGGVPVGYAVAKQLGILLDVMLVRKIPIPWEPEAGFGSVTFDGSTFLNERLVRSLGLAKGEINKCIQAAKKGLQERTKKFLAIKKEGLLTNIPHKVVILVDDGLASGYTMLASVESIKNRKPANVIVAVPTASLMAVHLVSPNVDKLICLNLRSSPYFAVADAYENWYDVTEEEALKLTENHSVVD